MQGKFGLALALLVVIATMESISGCKTCGSPWMGAESEHDPMTLDITEQRPNRPALISEEPEQCYFCGGVKHPIPEADLCTTCGGYVYPRAPNCLRKNNRLTRKWTCDCKLKKTLHK